MATLSLEIQTYTMRPYGESAMSLFLRVFIKVCHKRQVCWAYIINNYVEEMAGLMRADILSHA